MELLSNEQQLRPIIFLLRQNMSVYKFLKAVIQDEELQDEIRKAKVDLGLDDEGLVKVALIDYFKDSEEKIY